MRTRLLFAVVVFLATALCAHAGSATWKETPIDGSWNNSRNWTPRTIPNSASDVATFAASSLTDIAVGAPTEVASIVFPAGASAYSISDVPTIGLTMSGVGVQNNSGLTQHFIAAPGDFGVGSFVFTNGATAGSLTLFTLQGGTFSGQGGGLIQFFGNASAEEGTFSVEGAGDLEGGAGNVIFYDSTSAANANFSLTAGTGPVTSLVQFRGTSTAGSGIFASTGVIYFLESADAGTASIALNGAPGPERGAGVVLLGDDASAANATIVGAGGTEEFFSGAAVFFFGNSDAGNSHLVANGDLASAGGATIYFQATSTGGNCAVEVNGRGSLEVSLRELPGIAVGSLQGDGSVFLGSNNLAVGSNHMDAFFSGVIQDGGINGGFGGSLTKEGAGTLILSGLNFYTGGTTVNGGTLLAITKQSSATGTGPVQVNAGALGGTSRLAGAITLGTSNGPGAFLLPGTTRPGTLSTQGSLSFQADAFYFPRIATAQPRADQVAARGVTIAHGAHFTLTEWGNRTLPVGTSFTVINNTSRLPIAGSFVDLPEGAIVFGGRNYYEASYQGGTGNDLTLTVVP